MSLSKPAVYPEREQLIQKISNLRGQLLRKLEDDMDGTLRKTVDFVAHYVRESLYNAPFGNYLMKFGAVVGAISYYVHKGKVHSHCHQAMLNVYTRVALEKGDPNAEDFMQECQTALGSFPHKTNFIHTKTKLTFHRHTGQPLPRRDAKGQPISIAATIPHTLDNADSVWWALLPFYIFAMVYVVRVVTSKRKVSKLQQTHRYIAEEVPKEYLRIKSFPDELINGKLKQLAQDLHKCLHNHDAKQMLVGSMQFSLFFAIIYKTTKFDVMRVIYTCACNIQYFIQLAVGLDPDEEQSLITYSNIVQIAFQKCNVIAWFAAKDQGAVAFACLTCVLSLVIALVCGPKRNDSGADTDMAKVVLTTGGQAAGGILEYAQIIQNVNYRYRATALQIASLKLPLTATLGAAILQMFTIFNEVDNIAAEKYLKWCVQMMPILFQYTELLLNRFRRDTQFSSNDTIIGGLADRYGTTRTTIGSLLLSGIAYNLMTQANFVMDCVWHGDLTMLATIPVVLIGTSILESANSFKITRGASQPIGTSQPKITNLHSIVQEMLNVPKLSSVAAQRAQCMYKGLVMT